MSQNAGPVPTALITDDIKYTFTVRIKCISCSYDRASTVESPSTGPTDARLDRMTSKLRGDYDKAHLNLEHVPIESQWIAPYVQ